MQPFFILLTLVGSFLTIGIAMTLGDTKKPNYALTSILIIALVVFLIVVLMWMISGLFPTWIPILKAWTTTIPPIFGLSKNSDLVLYSKQSSFKKDKFALAC